MSIDKHMALIVGIAVSILLIVSCLIPIVNSANSGSGEGGPNPDTHGVTLGLQISNINVDTDYTNNMDGTFTINQDRYRMSPQIIMAWDSGTIYVDDSSRTVLVGKINNKDISAILTSFTATTNGNEMVITDSSGMTFTFPMPTYIYNYDKDGEYSSWPDTTDLKKKKDDPLITVGSYAGVDCYYNSNNRTVIQNIPLNITVNANPSETEIVPVEFEKNKNTRFSSGNRGPLKAVPTPSQTDADWGYDIVSDGGVDKAIIVSYNGPENVLLTIPATVGGYPVMQIGKGGLNETVIPTTFKVNGIYIEDGPTKIGAYAFCQCKGISGDLRLPDTLIEVGTNAFRGCGGGSFNETNGISGTLTIPESVTTIEDYAFRFLTKVDRIVIGSNVRTIGMEAFFQSTMYQTTGNVPKLYFHGPQPTSIGTGAFGFGQSSAKVTADVYSPGNWASAILNDYKNNNTTFNFGDSINEWDFTIDQYGDATITGYTGSSTELDIPSIVGADRPVKYIGEDAFRSGNYTKVIIPDTVWQIGNRAFLLCSNLTEVVFNEGIEYIGVGAFSSTSITEVTLPDTILWIDNEAFNGCNDLTDVDMGLHITKIGAAAFGGCTSLVNVSMGNSVNLIENHAFAGCTSLENITLPRTVTVIGDFAFYNCSSLTEIVIPSSVTTIGENAYGGCTSVTMITFEDEPSSIGANAFALGTVLTPVTATVKSMGNWASTILDSHKNEFTTFRYVNLGDWTYTIDSNGDATITGYVGLETDVTMPSVVDTDKPVKYIAADALKYTNIQSIVIPSSVESIGDFAFEGCDELTTVTFNEGLKYIGTAAFYMSGITTLNLPDSLETIDQGAFMHCYSLTDVTFGQNLRSISIAAFDTCSELTSVTFGNSLERIEEYAFRDCTKLKDMTIPDSVKYIGIRAFENCTSLTGALVLGSNIVEIGEFAFSNCTGYTSLISSMNDGTTIDTLGTLTNVKEVLNLGTLELTTTSYGLNADEVRTTIEACCYLAPLEIPGEKGGIASEVINMIPLLLIAAVMMFAIGFIIYRR